MHTFGCVQWAYTRRRRVRHKQVRTRFDSGRQKNYPSPFPTRGSNLGWSDLNFDSLTTELVSFEDCYGCYLVCESPDITLLFKFTVGQKKYIIFVLVSAKCVLGLCVFPDRDFKVRT